MVWIKRWAKAQTSKDAKYAKSEKLICELKIMKDSASNLTSPIPTPIKPKKMRITTETKRLITGPNPFKIIKAKERKARIFR
jgi:hypothetical protein